MKNFIVLSFFGVILFACSQKSTESQQTEEVKEVVSNYDRPNSDSMAIALAEKVLDAHGGEAAWNNTQVISWKFLGKRTLEWDKQSGWVYINYPQENSEYYVNIHTDSGQVKLDGKFIASEDSLNFYIKRARQIWVNDSYWLVFPFKFLDPGVQLGYEGQMQTNDSTTAEVISLTFDQVGYTPQNKYLAYIDPETNLLLQWDFYGNKNDSLPAISQLWSDYQQYGEIMLSSGRGGQSLAPITVRQEMQVKGL